MDIDAIKNTLSQSFQHLEEITPNIFCATDKYRDKPYAVRYFDLSDNITSLSEGLNEYLDNVLGENYFDVERPVDLRWNNYLYFITSDKHQQDEAFLRAKSIIESDREYARKFVIMERDLPKYLRLYPQEREQAEVPIQDIYSTWLKLLNDQQLGYMLDFKLKVPAIVRKIGSGELGKLEQTNPVGELNSAEHDAISHPIQSLKKSGFRKYPKENDFRFGSRVNLITGPNGHGKTSLLEAIEFLYCGTTFRNGPLGTRTHITASLLNSQEVLETRSAKNFIKRLKARNLGWYGKNDVRGSSLYKSFARFNFMDTDAAVRLSVEITAEQLSEDIARIVLGAEAGKASDQIQRILIELEKQRNVNTGDIYQSGVNIRILNREKDSLSAMTKQSDTLLQQLNQHLQIMGWTGHLKNADDISINALSENLDATNHQCKLLEGSNLNDLRKRRQELELYNVSLIKIVKTTSGIDAELKSFNKKKIKVIDKLNLIEELQTYSGLDLLLLDKKHKEQTEIINTLRGKLPVLQHLELIDSNLASLFLDKALTTTDDKLSKVRSERYDALIRIEEHERTQSKMTNLRDQLVSTATNILETSIDKDHCPLCNTKFEKGQLMLSIANNTTGVLEVRSKELRNKLAITQTSETDLEQTKSLITALIDYCDDTSNITVSLALENIQEDKRKISEYQESLKAINTKLTNYSERGLKANRLKEIIDVLGITNYSTSNLAELQHSLRAESKDITKEINNKEVELDAANQKILVLVEKAGLSKSQPVATLSKAIAMEVVRCDQRIAAATELARYLSLDEDFSVIALSHRINEARDIVSKIITTRKREDEENIRSQQIDKQINVIQAALEGKQKVLGNLSRATDVLSDLLSGQNSLESIKHELLKSNASVISEIFSKIHLPNEYDLNVEGEEVRLIDKVSGGVRSLKEVSTGQRSAFALSLFLTMNKMLGNGPKVLLLDDPISHIDDVNMLSFLDYLRELTIDGSRQIFFATPNAKLAGLFRHKFGFLDDNEFKEIRLTR